MRSSYPALICLIGLIGVPSLAAQEVRVGGQIRPRMEFRDPVGAGNDGFTSMRTRLHLNAALARRVGTFLEVQDVRLWGEETNTLNDFQADNLDLHQAYFDVRFAEERGAAVRVGRQEVTLGGERLIGPVGWTQQGRSFDGLRASYEGGWGRVDVLAIQLAEATSATIEHDAELAGAYAHFSVLPGGAMELYGLFNHQAGQAETKQFTVGARLAGTQSVVSYRAEGSYQAGDRAGVDVAAYMVGARVGASFAGGKGQATLWYDYLSGDANPADDKVKVFETLYATNHKFYGFADLFLDIPSHTGGLGLQDMAVKGSFAVRDDLRFNADLHTFSLAKQGSLTSRHLGEEIDLTGTYRFSGNLSAIGGLSRVFASTALSELGRLSEDMTFTYIMINAAF
ncbi:MAG TPA: alginate export family protein [Gemmatimonadales bacterium]